MKNKTFPSTGMEAEIKGQTLWTIKSLPTLSFYAPVRIIPSPDSIPSTSESHIWKFAPV